MSRTIDERVVELRFNNQQFEQNARTSIGTLEKLKQLLNFSKSEDALQGIDRSARRVDMSGIESAVDRVHVKFSALEIAGVAALVNIANHAINTGKQMLNSLTLAPISDGFQEYELKMGSIQTIMMSTGESLTTVNRYLDELNTYADKTIYSFKDMTSNIGKFTNAGVGLEDAVKAIQGVSNEAAISGANTWEASRAMYNFAQALSSGSVRLIDWKSIENANMATVDFKQTLLDTAEALGTVVKGENGYVTTTTDLTGKVSDAFTTTMGFNDSLSHQWMTTKVLTTALQAYSNDVRDMTSAEKKEYEEKLRSIGYTEDQIKRIEKLGSKAFDAAQEIKTFSQMMDTLKEAVGSGWARTWELIFGDFEVAKKLWTGIGNFVGGIIDEQAERRNNLLEQWTNLWSIEDGGRGKLFRSFARIADRVQEYIEPIKNAWRSIMPEIDVWTLRKITWGFSNLTKHMKWNGETYVNLGFAAKGFFAILRLIGTTALKVGQYSLPVLKEALDLVCRRLLELAGPVGYQVADMIKNLLESGDMDAFFKNISDNLINFIHKIDEGITAFQNGGIAGFKDWFVDQFESIDFGSIRQTVVGGVASIVDGVGNIFGKSNLSRTLYDLGTSGVRHITNFTGKIKEAADIMSSKGVKGFATWFTDQISGIDVSKAISTLLDKFKVVVDRIGKFFGHDSLFSEIQGYVSNWTGGINNFFAKQFEKVGFDKVYSSFESKFRSFVDNISAIFGKNSLFERIGNIKDGAIDRLKSFVSIIQSLFKNNGLDTAAKDTAKQVESVNNATSLFEAIGNFFTNNKIINGIRDFVTNQSIFDKFGEVINTMKTSLGDLGKLTSDFKADAGKNLATFGEAFSSFIDRLGSKLDDIDWVGVAAAAGQIATMLFAFQALRTVAIAINTTQAVVKAATGTLSAIKGFFGKVNGVLDNFTVAKTWTAKFKSIAKSLVTLSIAIAIIAGSIKVLGGMDQDELVRGGVAVALILFSLMGVQIALSKFAKGSEVGTAANVLAFAIGIKAIASALVDISDVLSGIDSWQDAGKYIGALVVVLGSMLGSALALAAINKKFGKIGGIKSMISLIAFVLALKLLINVLKDLESFKIDNYFDFVNKLGIVLGALLGIAFMASASSFGGGMGVLALVAALRLLVSSLDIVANLDLDKAKANIESFIAVFGTIAVLIAMTNLGGEHAKSAGIAVLAMAVAIRLLAGVINLLGSMDPKKAARGVVLLIGLMTGMIGLLFMMSVSGEHAIKAGIAMIPIAIALGLMTGVILLIGSMKPSVAARGITALVILMLSIGTLMVATSVAGEHALAASIAIGIITLAIGGLIYAIYILGQMNSGDLIKAVTALTLIMSMMSIMMVLSKFTSTSSMTGILALSGSVAILAASLVALAFVPEDQLQSALSVIRQLGFIMVALLFVSQYTSGATIGKVLVIGAVIGVLSGVMAALGILLKDIDGTNMLKQMTAISLVVVAMGGVLGVLSALNVGPGDAAKAGAAFDIFVSIIGLMAYAAGELDQMFGIGDKIEQGIGVMNKVGEAIGSFINGIGKGILGDNTQKIDSSGVDKLPSFGEKILGLVNGITEAADKVAGKESSINALQNIAGVVMAFAKAELVDGIASFIGGASQFTDFSKTLDTLATGLAVYADKVKEGNFSSEAVESSIHMAELLATLYGSDDLRSGGFIGDVVGNSIGLDNFGDQLYELASGLISYSMLINTETFNDDKIEASTKLASLLATLYGSDDLKSGGFIAGIVGDSIGLDNFGDQLQKLAQGLVLYVEEINKGDFKEDQIEKSKRLAKMLVSLSGSEQLTRGGVLAALSGDVIPLDTFGTQLAKLALGLKQYVDQINDANFNQTQIDKSESLAKMLAALATNDIPTSGGLLGVIFGGKDLGHFGASLGKLADGVVTFVKKLDEGNISDTSVRKATNLAATLRTIANAANVGVPVGLDKYGQQLVSFGTSIKSFLKEISGIDTGVDLSSLKPLMDSVSEVAAQYADTLNSISEASESISIDLTTPVNQLKQGAKDIEEAVKTIREALTSGFQDGWKDVALIISTSGADVVSATKGVADDAKEALTGAAISAKWKSAGRELTKALGDGVKNSGSVNGVKRAAKKAATEGSKGAKDTKSKWIDVGEALSDGLAKGVKNHAGKIESAAKQAARDAYNAAKRELESRSPSKKTMRLGKWFDQGLAIGIRRNAFGVVKSARTLAKNAVDAASNSLLKISELMNSDMVDSPIIRPVMDLSEIQNGSNRLYSMMSDMDRYSLHGNISLASDTSRSVDTDRRYKQQRDNDALSALIDGLKALKEQNEAPRGNTYIIDGITYDDGSNVSTAIDMLVRAAKVGGRA